MKFDVRQTNITKGIALILLLYHHLFYNSTRISKFTSLFYVSNLPIDTVVARLFKVCVAIFLVLSGYGIYKSYNSYSNNISVNNQPSLKLKILYLKNRLIKVLSDYWLIYLIFVPVGIFFGHSFIDVYEKNIIYALLDFFGIASVFNTPTMNATWWYMGTIIVFYLLTPLIYKVIDYSPLVTFSFVLLFSFFEEITYTKWLVAFVFGMCLARYNVFEKLEIILNSKTKKALFTFSLLIFSALLRLQLSKYINERFAIKFDFIYAFSIILLSYFFISKITLLNSFLEKTGKLSGKIFIFHTFIYSYYFEDFIYSFKYPIFIFLVLFGISIIVALLIEYISKITKYDVLIKKLTKI